MCQRFLFALLELILSEREISAYLFFLGDFIFLNIYFSKVYLLAYILFPCLHKLVTYVNVYFFEHLFFKSLSSSIYSFSVFTQISNIRERLFF